MRQTIALLLTLASVYGTETVLAQNAAGRGTNSIPPGGLYGVPSYGGNDRYRGDNYREGYREGFRDGVRDRGYRDGYRDSYPIPVYRGGQDFRGFGYPVNDVRAPYRTNPYPYGDRYNPYQSNPYPYPRR